MGAMYADPNSAARPQVVVETRGGTVVAIYSSDPSVKVMLIDWDELEAEGRVGANFPVEPLEGMDKETREAYGCATSDQTTVAKL
jgi:hypothetical protein